MSRRTLTRLVAAAGIILALWLVLFLLPSGDGGGSVEADADWEAFFEGLGPESVSTIEIREGDEVRTIVRTDGGWTVNGYETEPSVVERFWSTVEGTSVADLVATNPENHARLGIVPDSALEVTFQGPGEPRTLLVGGDGPTPGSAYVRRPSEDAVYLAMGGLRTQVARSVTDWRDKRVLLLDTARVARIEVERPEGSYAIARVDSTWSIDGAQAQPAAVVAILEELAGMRATDFPVEGDSLYQAPEEITVGAFSQTGDTLGVVTLSAGERDRAARVLGNETVYRVPGFRIDRIAPPRERVEPPG